MGANGCYIPYDRDDGWGEDARWQISNRQDRGQDEEQREL